MISYLSLKITPRAIGYEWLSTIIQNLQEIRKHKNSKLDMDTLLSRHNYVESVSGSELANNILPGLITFIVSHMRNFGNIIIVECPQQRDLT